MYAQNIPKLCEVGFPLMRRMAHICQTQQNLYDMDIFVQDSLLGIHNKKRPVAGFERKREKSKKERRRN